VAEGNAALIVRGETAEQLDLGQEILSRLAFMPFGIVGAVIVARQPRNTIGWLCCAIGLGTSLCQFVEDYAFKPWLATCPVGRRSPYLPYSRHRPGGSSSAS
jgi:hypothetical protein